GMTRGSTNAHIARAALDSIAFQTVDLLKAMEADAGIHIAALRVDGGATTNNLLMQIQSDLLQTTVTRPTTTETTALGAAYLAGLAVGYWWDTAEIQSLWQMDREFEPQQPNEAAQLAYKGWQKAVAATREFKP
ncbi:MAG: glycerol kinase, partial [Flavobacteriia bacterium]